jgi:hypothetical protein
MTEDAENIVLVQLREISARLDGIDACCVRMETRLGKIDKLDHDNEALRSQLNTIVELAGAATRRARAADAKAAQALNWQENFDTEMERLEKKLPKN